MNWQIKIRIADNKYLYFSPGKKLQDKEHIDVPFLSLPNILESNKVGFSFEKDWIYFTDTRKRISPEIFGNLLQNNLVKVDGQCQVFKTENFIPPKIKLYNCKQCGKETKNYFRCFRCIYTGTQFAGEILGHVVN